MSSSSLISELLHLSNKSKLLRSFEFSKYITVDIKRFGLHISHESKCCSDLLLTLPQVLDQEYCEKNIIKLNYLDNEMFIKPLIENDYSTINEMFLLTKNRKYFEDKESSLRVLQTYIKFSCIDKYLDLIYRQVGVINNSFFLTFYKRYNEVWIMIDVLHKYDDLQIVYSQNIDLSDKRLNMSLQKGIPTSVNELKTLTSQWYKCYMLFEREFVNFSMTVMVDTELDDDLIFNYDNCQYSLQVDNIPLITPPDYIPLDYSIRLTGNDELYSRKLHQNNSE